MRLCRSACLRHFEFHFILLFCCCHSSRSTHEEIEDAHFVSRLIFVRVINAHSSARFHCCVFYFSAYASSQRKEKTSARSRGFSLFDTEQRLMFVLKSANILNRNTQHDSHTSFHCSLYKHKTHLHTHLMASTATLAFSIFLFVSFIFLRSLSSIRYSFLSHFILLFHLQLRNTGNIRTIFLFRLCTFISMTTQ